MSANRERIFHHPSLESPFSGRERYDVRVRDKKDGRLIKSGYSAEVQGEAVIVNVDGYCEKAIFSLNDVIVYGDRIKFTSENSK